MVEDVAQAQRLEQRTTQLFLDLLPYLKGTYKSVQLMQDDNFVHRRDRTSNDIHAFFELHDGEYFHLRGYTRHMLQHPDLAENEVYLTGYRKGNIAQTGGSHSLRQNWYDWDPQIVAQEILAQNPDIFYHP